MCRRAQPTTGPPALGATPPHTTQSYPTNLKMQMIISPPCLKYFNDFLEINIIYIDKWQKEKKQAIKEYSSPLFPVLLSKI